MEPLTKGALLDGGLKDDIHFSPDSMRQLLLVQGEALEELSLSPGQIRENITLRGVDVMQLSPGTMVDIGEARVEITKECAPCQVMEGIRHGLREELIGRRGMYARVVRPGVVRQRDPARVVETAPLSH